MTMYRIIYRDGSYGAWNTDKEWVEYLVKKFKGFLDTKEA